MQVWFTDANLARASPPAQRLFGDICRLLDQLQPSNLAVDRQTATVDGGGEAIIRLVHISDRDADLDIEVGDLTTHVYGLHGHDEDYGLKGDAEKVWRADSIDTIAGLLRGRFLVERVSWQGRPYRTRITDVVGNARNVTSFDSLLGWLPVPQRALSVARHEIDYAIRPESSESAASN